MIKKVIKGTKHTLKLHFIPQFSPGYTYVGTVNDGFVPISAGYDYKSVFTFNTSLINILVKNTVILRILGCF